MGNVDINQIRKKGFEEGSRYGIVENYCRTMASEHTDAFIEKYSQLIESRKGSYINSDLMKMVYPFYAINMNNRKIYNTAITNSAAVLTNEAYRRAIQNPETKRCIYILGPYGAGKSFFVQSLYSNDASLLPNNSIVYEGSITPPAFDEKIEFAIENGVIPELIILNPTLELSLRNIKERAKRIGRDVEKSEVIDKYSNLYIHLKNIVNKYKNIPYVIYNKRNNITLDLSSGSTNIEDLNHGTIEEISAEYDRIIKLLEEEAHSL